MFTFCVLQLNFRHSVLSDIEDDPCMANPEDNLKVGKGN